MCALELTWTIGVFTCVSFSLLNVILKTVIILCEKDPNNRTSLPGKGDFSFKRCRKWMSLTVGYGNSNFTYVSMSLGAYPAKDSDTPVHSGPWFRNVCEIIVFTVKMIKFNVFSLSAQLINIPCIQDKICIIDPVEHGNSTHTNCQTSGMSDLFHTWW